MTPHASKVELLIISVSHIFVLLKNISHMSMKIFHSQVCFFNPWEGVKVGSSEIFLITTHVGPKLTLTYNLVHSRCGVTWDDNLIESLIIIFEETYI